MLIALLINFVFFSSKDREKAQLSNLELQQKRFAKIAIEKTLQRIKRMRIRVEAHFDFEKKKLQSLKFDFPSLRCC